MDCFLDAVMSMKMMTTVSLMMKCSTFSDIMLTEGMQECADADRRHAAVGCSTFSDIMLAMLAKLFWPSLLSLTKLPAKDWGPSLLFLLDLCISSTLCRHRRAMSEG